jgi:hypothetical protein
MTPLMNKMKLFGMKQNKKPTNCIEALRQQLESCITCRLNSIIIEFEQLPEHEKMNFDYYDKEKYFLIYCEPCKIYKILPV